MFRLWQFFFSITLFVLLIEIAVGVHGAPSFARFSSVWPGSQMLLKPRMVGTVSVPSGQEDMRVPWACTGRQG